MSQLKNYFIQSLIINVLFASLVGILFFKVAYAGDWLILTGQTFIVSLIFFMGMNVFDKANTIIKQNVEIKKILGNKKEETRIR